jgi:hypothetical protein
MSYRFLSLLLLASLPASSALLSAQSDRPSFGTPNFELYGGYSYVFNSYDHTNNNLVTGGMNGWDASFKVPVIGPLLGIKGDVSGQYRNDAPDFNPKVYFFLLGPQVGLHLGRSTLFAHGMVGSAHLNQEAIPSLTNDNTLAVAVGGGLDAGFSPHLAWRVTGDYYNTHFKSGDNTVNGITNSNGRVSTGPVLRF